MEVEIPARRGNFGVARPIERRCKARDFARLDKKTKPTETAEMPFGLLTHVCPRNSVLDEESIRVRELRQVCDAAFCQTSLDTCCCPNS